MNLTRRALLGGLLAAIGARSARLAGQLPPGLPYWTAEVRGDSSVATALRLGQLPDFRRTTPTPAPPTVEWSAVSAYLRDTFPDLPRHFVFEYYPWYATDPWRHWDQWDRRPPIDIAATSVPVLGAYDSRSRRVLEQHAAWIAAAGVGAINVSWWGRDSFCDRAVPLLMDVMRDHDIHVTFHLESYRDDRATYLVDDIVYLLRTYGDRRNWDAFLLLKGADGKVGPVFKIFRTILPPEGRDCHGVVHQVPDYTPDAVWRRQAESVRRELEGDFDRVTLLADSLDFARANASGFDGVAIYDNFVPPSAWGGFASAASQRDLLFSFNVNAGFDSIEMRDVEPDSCYRPPDFEPPPADDLDWSDADDREEARRLSRARIIESFHWTIRLQTDAALANRRRGFFLTYINSFNEWHEGTQFEPMKDAAQLTREERALDYHNPRVGDTRLRDLAALMEKINNP